MRARLLFVVIATGCAISAVTACSSNDAATAEAEAKKTTQASAVTIEMFDRSGNELGSCSGTLVAKDLVLTAGHCAAGVASWKIDAKGAGAKSEATRAVTPWKAFGSNLSHPDHADVALLVLKRPIVLDRYPGIASAKLDDGAKVLRVHRASANATEPGTSTLEVGSAKKKGFRLNYAAKIESGEYLDTGGAIIDAKTGKIHGVVSGKGMKSDLLYIARVDNFAKWVTKGAACGDSLAVRGYPGGGSSGGGGDPWGGGGDDWGGYGGSGKKLDGGAPDSGTSSSSSSSGSVPDSGTTTGTPPGDTTDTPGGPGGGTCPPPPSCEGECPGTPPGTDDPGTEGPGGDDDVPSTSSSSSGNSGDNPGTDVCPGPPSCPEGDSQTCDGPTCGGCAGVAGCVDATIDYGSCASCGSSKGTGTDPVVR